MNDKQIVYHIRKPQEPLSRLREYATSDFSRGSHRTSPLWLCKRVSVSYLAGMGRELSAGTHQIHYKW